MKIEDWGTIPYEEAWTKQNQYFEELIAGKQNGGQCCNRLIFCEHNPVYTLGRHGNDNNLLIDKHRLQQLGAEVKRVDRGGDITFHGPGQLVCYPILDLEHYHLGLKQYLHTLEEAVIRTCSDYGIHSSRVNGATGVWLDVHLPKERKICAMGVRSSHFITMHGLALNVNTDLNFFNYINPCGFTDKGVTSIKQELGHEVDLNQVKDLLKSHLITLLAE